MTTQIDERAYHLIENFESLNGLHEDGKYYPYRVTVDPPGLMTVGRGRALHGGARSVTVGGVTIDVYKNGLTLAQVNQLYREGDLAPRVKRLLQYIPHALPHEHGAFLSLLFNNEVAVATGSPGRFHREGRPKVEVAAKFLEYHKTFSHYDPKTKKKVYKNVLGLWRRRGTEALYYLTGEILIANSPDTEKAVFARLASLGVKFVRPVFPKK